MEEVSYHAADSRGAKIAVDRAYVRKHLADNAKDTDLSKFIL
jgi:ATP-dependent HslUV protease ATP-binding subunit HslU